jgi:group I intron endonuclease
MEIYKVLNKVNGKIYIGQTTKPVGLRFIRHLNSAKYGVKYKSAFLEALKKYGAENFEVKTIARCDTKEHLDQAEKFYINFFKSKAPDGYNLTDGGGSTYGFNQPEEANRKNREAHLGLVRSEETRKLISENKKGKKINYPKDRKGFPPWNKGLTKETDLRVAKIGKANTGRQFSDETRKSWSDQRSGINNPNYRHGNYIR